MNTKRYIFLIMAAVLMMGMRGCWRPKKEVILIADKRVLEIPIIENHEELVDLKSVGGISCGPSPEIPNNTNYTRVRKTVYEKLKQAQKLLPANLKFCIYEGYRSVELQRTLFEKRFKEVQQMHQDWSYARQFEETTRIVSPVENLDGTTNIPPHSTGGAIDIYLIDEKGNPVDMGIHPKDWMKDKDGSLSCVDSSRISSAAKQYRKIMSKALEQVGFINYKTEYWHWSYGDRYWAYHTKSPAAIYGSYAEAPVVETKIPVPVV